MRLPCDDVRYFTVDVRPPTKVLLLGETGDDALFLREALSPTAAAGSCNRSSLATSGRSAKSSELPLGRYAAVCLVDPPPLPAAAWQALVDYADGRRRGHFLGPPCAAARR